MNEAWYKPNPFNVARALGMTPGCLRQFRSLYFSSGRSLSNARRMLDAARVGDFDEFIKRLEGTDNDIVRGIISGLEAANAF